MYHKSHDRRNFYSTLCHTAKRNQRHNLIQSTQNDSTSVKHNSKTLAQNKFNTRPKSPNFKSNSTFSQIHFSLYSFLAVRFLFFVSVNAVERAKYIDKRHVPTNLLEYTESFSNSLKITLMLEQGSATCVPPSKIIRPETSN